MASFARKLADKFIAAAGTRLALAVNKWLVILHAAKMLPIDQFAAFAATLSIAEILRIIADSGTESIIYSRARAEGRPLPFFVRACFELRTATSVIICLIAVLIGWLVTNNSDNLPLLLMIVPLSLQSSAVALLQRSESQKKFFALGIFSLGVCSISTVFLIAGESQSQLIHALQILTPEASVAIFAVYLLKNNIYILRLSWSHFSRSIRTIYGLLWRSGLGAVIVISYSRLDVLLVKPLLGADLQADYSAGFRLVEPAAVLFGFATTALLSEFGNRGGLELKEKIGKVLLKIKLWQLIPSIFLCLLISVVIYFGAVSMLGFSRNASIVACLLALIMPVRAVSGIITAIQIRFSQMGSVLMATIVNLSMTLTISIVFARHYGIYAICAAALIGELASISYQLFNLSRFWKTKTIIPLVNQR